jgi:hypothetical protein
MSVDAERHRHVRATLGHAPTHVARATAGAELLVRETERVVFGTIFAASVRMNRSRTLFLLAVGLLATNACGGIDARSETTSAHASSSTPTAAPAVAPDAGSATGGVVPADTQSIVVSQSIDAAPFAEDSIDCGPANTAGISFVDSRYTVSFATREIAWRVCVDATPSPSLADGVFHYVRGQRALTDDEWASLASTLGALRVSTSPSCIADDAFGEVSVTTPASTTTFVDDRHSCQAPTRVELSGVDALASALRTIAGA